MTYVREQNLTPSEYHRAESAGFHVDILYHTFKGVYAQIWTFGSK
jgi:hypothetical protein